MKTTQIIEMLEKHREDLLKQADSLKKRIEEIQKTLDHREATEELTGLRQGPR